MPVALPTLTQELERAFLAGVEHVAGAEGCGAREAEAARQYAATRLLTRRAEATP